METEEKPSKKRGSRALTKTAVKEVIHQDGVITRREVQRDRRSINEHVRKARVDTVNEITEAIDKAKIRRSVIWFAVVIIIACVILSSCMVVLVNSHGGNRIIQSITEVIQPLATDLQATKRAVAATALQIDDVHQRLDENEKATTANQAAIMSKLDDLSERARHAEEASQEAVREAKSAAISATKAAESAATAVKAEYTHREIMEMHPISQPTEPVMAPVPVQVPPAPVWDGRVVADGDKLDQRVLHRYVIDPGRVSPWFKRSKIDKGKIILTNIEGVQVIVDYNDYNPFTQRQPDYQCPASYYMKTKLVDGRSVLYLDLPIDAKRVRFIMPVARPDGRLLVITELR